MAAAGGALYADMHITMSVEEIAVTLAGCIAPGDRSSLEASLGRLVQQCAEGYVQWILVLNGIIYMSISFYSYELDMTWSRAR